MSYKTLAAFRHTTTMAVNSAATEAASLLTSCIISEYLISLPSRTMAGLFLRMNGRSLCTRLPAHTRTCAQHVHTEQLHIQQSWHQGHTNGGWATSSSYTSGQTLIQQQMHQMLLVLGGFGGYMLLNCKLSHPMTRKRTVSFEQAHFPRRLPNTTCVTIFRNFKSNTALNLFPTSLEKEDSMSTRP